MRVSDSVAQTTTVPAPAQSITNKHLLSTFATTCEPAASDCQHCMKDQRQAEQVGAHTGPLRDLWRVVEKQGRGGFSRVGEGKTGWGQLRPSKLLNSSYGSKKSHRASWGLTQREGKISPYFQPPPNLTTS